jgi:hypothetical protein
MLLLCNLIPKCTPAKLNTPAFQDSERQQAVPPQELIDLAAQLKFKEFGNICHRVEAFWDIPARDLPSLGSQGNGMSSPRHGGYSKGTGRQWYILKTP